MDTKEANPPLSERVESVKEDPDARIPVDVSFRIIKQFSTQLYDSPRRAIEELACNSYDAAAENCYIRTPEDETEPLKVLDDGQSMDLEGLKWLWKIA
jgi:DNA mismatch repair ATPase MutL